jgi:hypothetical protein
MIVTPLSLDIILDANQDKLHIDLDKRRIVKAIKRSVTWADQDQDHKRGAKKLTPGQLAKKKYGSSKRINAKVARMAKKYPVKKSGSSKPTMVGMNDSHYPVRLSGVGK